MYCPPLINNYFLPPQFLDKNYTLLRNGIYYAHIIGIDYLPFPGFTARDICSLGVKCPVTPGVAVTETLTLEVSKDLITVCHGVGVHGLV